MKSFIRRAVALTVIAVVSVMTAAAQNFASSISGTASTTGAQPSISTINNGATYFTLTKTTTGSPASVSVQIEGSTDNGTTFNICGSADTITSANITICSGTFDHVRLNVTALSGGTSPTLIWSLTSFIAQAGVGTPTSVSIAGIAPVASGALETNHVFKASAGNMYSICATIGVTSGYLMVFDATSAPGDGAVTPKLWLFIPSISATANTGCINYAPGPPGVFSTGITAVFSTTGPFTKTASNAAFSGSVK